MKKRKYKSHKTSKVINKYSSTRKWFVIGVAILSLCLTTIAAGYNGYGPLDGYFSVPTINRLVLDDTPERTVLQTPGQERKGTVTVVNKKKGQVTSNIPEERVDEVVRNNTSNAPQSAYDCTQAGGTWNGATSDCQMPKTGDNPVTPSAIAKTKACCKITRNSPFCFNTRSKVEFVGTVTDKNCINRNRNWRNCSNYFNPATSVEGAFFCFGATGGGSVTNGWLDKDQTCQRAFPGAARAINQYDSCGSDVDFPTIDWTPCKKLTRNLFSGETTCLPWDQGIKTKVKCCGTKAGIEAKGASECRRVKQVSLTSTTTQTLSGQAQSVATDPLILAINSNNENNDLECKRDAPNCLSDKVKNIKDINGNPLQAKPIKCSGYREENGKVVLSEWDCCFRF